MHARFYAPEAQAPGEVVAIGEEETRHLTRVLRLEPGDAVLVFNGQGAQFDAVVERTAGARATLRIGARRPAAPEPRVAVTLAQAVLKGDRMDEVVRDAVMMGVAAIQPVVSARSEVTAATLERGHRRERWQRIAISSAKQCGRAVVPPVLAPYAFEALATALATQSLPAPGLMLVEPGAAATACTLGELRLAAPRQATVCIGPEGGWTSQEVERASTSCALVTLGGRTLRADAMPIVALAALFALWKEY